MICRPADAREDPVSDATGTVSAEKPIAIYLRDTPIGSGFGWTGVVLIVLALIASALLACFVYPSIWLCTKVRPPVRYFRRVETSAQKQMRHYRLETGAQP
jgi:hypothetical protein